MKTQLDVFQKIISSSVGAISSTTWASLDLRYVDPRDLVVEAVVAAVARHVLDHSVDDLDTGGTAEGLQAPDIGQYDVLQTPPKIFALPGLRTGAIVLHIDVQQCRVGRIDRHLAAQSVHRRKNSLYAAGSKRAKRSAQAF